MVKRVLIVDDDKEFLEELNETLNLSGYEMVAVNDARRALEAVHKEKPDVVLLDLKMPTKSGFQVADEIRHHQETAHIPIIAMTGYFKESQVPLMDMCGIDKCLKKPFNPLDVIAQIESVLGKGV